RGFVKVTRDITEKHHQEEQVQLYSDIVKNMQMGVAVLRLENPNDERSFRLVAANPAASTVLGFAIEKILNLPLVESCPDIYKTRLPVHFADIVHTGKALELGEIHYGDEHIRDGVYYVKAFPLPDSCV